MKKDLDDLIDILCRIKDQAFMREFIESLLTERELLDVALRLRLVKMLEKGHTQREIAKTLQISTCKITRGARELKKIDSAFKRALALIGK